MNSFCKVLQVAYLHMKKIQIKVNYPPTLFFVVYVFANFFIFSNQKAQT
jgi:hypothetical protein